MKALIQRVTRARVLVDDVVQGGIGPGMTVFLGIRDGDTADDARYLARRVSLLRIFNDAEEKMNLSVLDTGGQALIVSQFTLHADTRKGHRPSYVAAAPPDKAEELYHIFIGALVEAIGESNVATGVFRAMMRVELENDGPVTIMLKSKSEYGA